ncbi:hypothetical protein BBP40_003944 [Aspergillus hancockii]|nr:hypothetical protein BBP40_003944 [Aspergillus hancockii]
MTRESLYYVQWALGFYAALYLSWKDPLLFIIITQYNLLISFIAIIVCVHLQRAENSRLYEQVTNALRGNCIAQELGGIEDS